MKDDLYPQKIHILALGFCAVSTQAVFLRELLGLFHGTEFTLGFLLSSWLLWIAAGGLLGGGWSKKAQNKKRLTRILSIMTGALLPLTIIIIRLSRGILQEARGEFPGYLKALLFAFMIIGPFTFFYGMIYNTASALFREKFGSIRESITSVYRLEAAGSIAGALIFSFLLLRHFTQLEAAFIVFMTVLTVSLSTFRFSWRPFAIVTFGVAACLALLPSVAEIDSGSYARIFPQYDLKGFLSSKYAELVAVSREGMLSVYAGGSRVISIPEPEIVEETVHIPLLSHDDPVDLLIIGSSFESVIEESAKHPSVRSVDLMNLDDGISELIAEVSEKDPGRWIEIGDAGRESLNLRRIYGDPRALLGSTRKKYDLIIISVPEPINIQWNRFYTREFFTVVKNALAEGGIAAVSHISSENYISARQAVVLNIIVNTIREVFDDVAVIPGGRAHFIAGEDCVGIIAKIFFNLEDRALDTRYINGSFLPSRLSPERVEHLKSSLEAHALDIVNSDLYPVLPYHELILEAERKRSGAAEALEAVFRVPVYIFPAAVIVILALMIVFSRRRTMDRTAVFITGFSSFLFQISVMTLFQVFSGILYYGLILISAFFMTGISLGSSFRNPGSERPSAAVRFLHISFLILSAALVFLVLNSAGLDLMRIASRWILYAFSFLNGFITGSYYRVIVSSSYIENERSVPAVYYSTDLFGASLGGLIGGFFLLPVAGIRSTLLLMAAIHLMALFTIRIRE
ncbi:MAG: hypothetical protein JW746_10755 [Candidatus Krumholzibacteriota bacterium]|nr:hypothetical protein [Candidatus Krumholzibacteriota bacterium]